MDSKALFVSLLFMGVFVLVPVIALMTEHQRKMAKIVRGESEGTGAIMAELKALRAEVAALRSSSLLPTPSEQLVEELRMR